MRRQDLEHVVRAAADLTGERDIIVLGSQAILGSIDEDLLPIEATRSIEVDIALPFDPDGSRADRVDGAIGELSRFQETFGYYSHVVGIDTAALPVDWRDRLVVLDTPRTSPGRGLCLEPHDLVASKLAAWRPKDREYAAALLESGLISRRSLQGRVRRLEGVSDARKRMILDWVRTA
jgi:hypothetical protein